MSPDDTTQKLLNDVTRAADTTLRCAAEDDAIDAEINKLRARQEKVRDDGRKAALAEQCARAAYQQHIRGLL